MAPSRETQEDEYDPYDEAHLSGGGFPSMLLHAPHGFSTDAGSCELFALFLKRAESGGTVGGKAVVGELEEEIVPLVGQERGRSHGEMAGIFPRGRRDRCGLAQGDTAPIQRGGEAQMHHSMADGDGPLVTDGVPMEPILSWGIGGDQGIGAAVEEGVAVDTGDGTAGRSDAQVEVLAYGGVVADVEVRERPLTVDADGDGGDIPGDGEAVDLLLEGNIAEDSVPIGSIGEVIIDRLHDLKPSAGFEGEVGFVAEDLLSGHPSTVQSQ